jgi:phosphoribosyl-AMP cyclohydrolase
MDFSKLDGLIPAVVQDHVSGEVLMVGFMNEEAWEHHAAHRLRDVLQPHSQYAVDQGRDVGQQARLSAKYSSIAMTTRCS